MDDRQDSLRFRSLSAKYDLKTQTIFCNKVEYVRVGDAKIFPDSMKIIIHKNAFMEPLKNAVVVANYITQFHKFYKVDLTITSRSKFEGNGIYPYYDRDSLLTNLNMKTIAYNKNNALTIAEGLVEKKTILSCLRSLITSVKSRLLLIIKVYYVTDQPVLITYARISIGLG